MIRRARILLADDHVLIVAGVRTLLEAHYDLVGQVGDGRSLVEAAVRLRPDLIILDVTMPMLNGIDAAQQIKKAWPQAKLLFLSMHASTAYLQEAFNAGGSGYVLKSSAAEELRTAIQKVLSGQTYVAPSLEQGITQGVLRQGGLSAQLTERQREVLQLIAEGRGNKEIATILGVSVKTVEFHRGRLMERLGVHGVAELVRCAVQAGLVGE